MTTIIKRNGKTEEFDRKKIEDSVRNAEADWLTAKDIAARILERDGMTTSDIRCAINKELKNINQGLSQRYSQARRFTVKNSVKTAKGVAQLSKDSMDALKIKAGDTLEIKYRDKCQKMRIEKDNNTVFHNEIKLNEDDMVAIGVIDGNRVIARNRS